MKTVDLVISGICFFLLLLTPFDVSAREEAPPDTTNHVMQQAPRVFVDCQFCDMDYIRREVKFANYVWDRKNAQVHVLASIQRTGGGGREFTLTFIGLQNFAGQNDTLTYSAGKTATEYEIREGLVRIFKLGLTQYAMKTPVAVYLDVTFDRNVETQEIQNKWNNWVFSISGSTFMRGEESSNTRNLSTELEAERVTHQWKLRFQMYDNYDEDQYVIDDTTNISITKGYGTSGLVVRSLTQRWSVGFTYRVYSSTYYNRKFAAYIYPGIEYNIFPYSESTRRELRINYGIGPNYNQYLERTIFGKTEELIARQNLEIALDQIQPWGDLNVSLDYSTYMHDFSKNQISFSANADIRIYKGFSVDLWGTYSFIHNQIYLRQGEATQEDILLQRRALATGYRYYGRVRLEYSFGAISNNIVNPRFGR